MFRLKVFIPLFAIVLLLAACNLPQSGAPTQDISFIQTAAAQTVVAEMTQSAPTPTAGNVVINDPADGATQTAPANTTAPTATATAQPSATADPTATPQPTATHSPTATPIPCLRVEFVKDVEIPDGAELSPGQSFTKVWRLKNTGSCSWTRDTTLVFLRGDDMGDDNIPLPHTVRPGETVDAEVELTAPDEEGTYTGYWMLRDEGTRFGLGRGGDAPFWVEIEVVAPEDGDIYNFAANYCQADWESSDGELDCPGDTEDDWGFVTRLNNPDLENRHENEPTLWTNPEMVTDGWISGSYPEIEVQAGDHLMADIGCLEGYDRCDVVFRLSYRIDGDVMKTLGEWHEVYDGLATRVNIDLSSLAGEDVEFIFTVLANGSSRDDAAFWLNPKIVR